MISDASLSVYNRFLPYFSYHVHITMQNRLRMVLQLFSDRPTDIIAKQMIIVTYISFYELYFRALCRNWKRFISAVVIVVAVTDFHCNWKLIIIFFLHLDNLIHYVRYYRLHGVSLYIFRSNHLYMIVILRVSRFNCIFYCFLFIRISHILLDSILSYFIKLYLFSFYCKLPIINCLLTHSSFQIRTLLYIIHFLYHSNYVRLLNQYN